QRDLIAAVGACRIRGYLRRRRGCNPQHQEEKRRQKQMTHEGCIIKESGAAGYALMEVPRFLGYVLRMPAWFDNPQAAYVLAAYAVAALVLAGLLVASWYMGRKRKTEWRQTEKEHSKDRG